MSVIEKIQIDPSSRHIISICFGHDEVRALDFVDRHWNRIAYVAHDNNTDEIPVWIVYIYEPVKPIDEDTLSRKPARRR